MQNWRIPLYKIYSDDEDLNIITKIIKRGNNWAIGPEIEEFENTLKKYVGTDYCCVLNSGTSALHATLLAYDLGAMDEIITSSFSFISTANSILFVGSKPIFADIESITYGLDPDSIRKSITSNTKAIMPMDYGGMSCNISEISQIAKENNLLLIEDAAESLGSTINGKKVGTISDSAIFSFCGNKVLTTGEGGAIVTNSEEIFKKVSLIRSHGRVDTSNYFDNPNQSDYVGLGYNWRMSSITAALGISQLQKLDKIIKKRRINAEYLNSRLKTHDQIKVPIPPSGYEHIYQMYTIELDNKNTRDNLQKFLTQKQIFSKVYFSPIHQTSFYKQKFPQASESLPITNQISEKVLTLPLYPNMENEEKDYLIQSIHEFFEKKLN